MKMRWKGAAEESGKDWREVLGPDQKEL